MVPQESRHRATSPGGSLSGSRAEARVPIALNTNAGVRGGGTVPGSHRPSRSQPPPPHQACRSQVPAIRPPTCSNGSTGHLRAMTNVEGAEGLAGQ